MKKFVFYLFIIAGLSTTLPCIAMEDQGRQPAFVIRKFQGKTIPELQEMEATISYSLMPQTMGNILGSQGDVFKVTGVPIQNEENISKTYNLLNENIKTGYILGGPFNATAGAQSHVAARCEGGMGLTLIGTDSFEGNQALFGSQRNIAFTSKKFNFKTSFIDVDPSSTVFTIFPEPSLNSPIEFLEFKPVKTPLFVQGEIDFTTLSFKDFVVSNASFTIKFKK